MANSVGRSPVGAPLEVLLFVPYTGGGRCYYEPGSCVGELPGHFADILPMMNMASKKDTKRREIGCSSRFSGGIVPAPGRSTSETSGPEDSCEGLAAELPTGPAAESATVRTQEKEEVETRITHLLPHVMRLRSHRGRRGSN